MLHSTRSGDVFEGQFREGVFGRGKRSEVSIVGQDRRLPVAVFERQDEDGDIFRLNAGESGEELGLNGRSTFIEQRISELTSSRA